MNALTIQQPRQVTVAADHDPTAMFKMAQAIAAGKLFGSTDPNAVFTLMLLAQAEGKHPGLVMRDYHVINGKPAKKADAMLVDFLASGGKVEWHALTDELADATFSHPQGGSVRISWDEARVKRAQLGGNQMHGKYPRQMKRARVISEGVRTVFPGATGGLYVPEEVADFDEVPMRNVTPAPRQSRPAPARAPTPFDVAPEPPAMGEEAPGHDGPTSAEEVAAPAEGSFDMGEPTIFEEAREIEAKFKAAGTVEAIDAAWKLTSADRKRIVAEDERYGEAFVAAFKAAKTALVGEVA